MAAARENGHSGEAPPDLVLFDDALSHLLRVSRLLAMDRGSVLLVGVGGSGKQSLARLASYLSGATMFKVGKFSDSGHPFLYLLFLYSEYAPVSFLLHQFDSSTGCFYALFF